MDRQYVPHRNLGFNAGTSASMNHDHCGVASEPPSLRRTLQSSGELLYEKAAGRRKALAEYPPQKRHHEIRESEYREAVRKDLRRTMWDWPRFPRKSK
jgi:hypothetical protein